MIKHEYRKAINAVSYDAEEEVNNFLTTTIYNNTNPC